MKVLYSTPTCPKCKVAKLKLEKAGIEFEVCQDENELMKLMEATGAASVPVLIDEEGTCFDFNGIMQYIRGAAK